MNTATNSSYEAPGYFWLPVEKPDQNEAGKVELVAEKKEFSSQSVVFIGGNGSGKSRLGAWIEKQDYSKTLRIGSQRNLCFSAAPQLMQFEKAEKLVIEGRVDASRKYGKWAHGETTQMVNDFDAVLSGLIARKNYEHDEFVASYDSAVAKGARLPSSPDTVIKKICRVWDAVFPHRKLIIKDARFFCNICKNGQDSKEYSATEMSDGERGVLYLAAQVLMLKTGRIIIVDEPDIHLHPSIMYRLWVELEALRKDCRFIYITHDISFATSHCDAVCYWVKSYDGAKWDIVPITDDDLPQELLLEVLGTRKPILFVEGEPGSWDSKLYGLIFPDFTIKACGGCGKVIEATKTFAKHYPKHLAYGVCGIIDRDYRSRHEIECNRRNGVYVCEVAEVENLFIVKPLIDSIMEHLQYDDNDKKSRWLEIENLIRKRFKDQLKQQRTNSLKARLHHFMENCNLDDIKSESDLECQIQKEQPVTAAIDENDRLFPLDSSQIPYEQILKVFNSKKLASDIGAKIIAKEDYFKRALALLKSWSLEKRRGIFNEIIPIEEIENKFKKEMSA